MVDNYKRCVFRVFISPQVYCQKHVSSFKVPGGQNKSVDKIRLIVREVA